MLRQPIISVMGHVDHGKTLLLDKIRGTAVISKEAGGITQAIGASIIPSSVIKKICGDLLNNIKIDLTIPGLLFIDTPGHAAFINLRKRGGNLADIAVLVIDINEGLMPQTIESIEILKQYKTPFIIALNKIDLIQGWQSKKKSLLTAISELPQSFQTSFETKLYSVVGKVFELGFESDRFDRVGDYTKQVAIVPISAKTGDGIPELLMVIAGLSQRFLEKSLKSNVQGSAKGTVLEVKEQQGLGKVIDVIIYDGTLNVGDQIVLGTLNGTIVTKVKALFEPAPLTEMRVKSHFTSVKKVSAAVGVRVVAPDIDDVIGGSPLVAVVDNVEEVKISVQKEIEEVLVETDGNGIIIKADNLGSLEALSKLLKEKNIPIRKASIGAVTKKDISDAEAVFSKDPLKGIILCFNLPNPEFSSDNIKVLTNNVIYRIIEDYEAWLENQKKSIELKEFESLISPCKIQLLKGYVFRQSNPAVVGIEVVEGVLKSNTPLMNSSGIYLTDVKGIQLEQGNIDKAEKNKQVAVSLSKVIIGRQIKEGDVLYSSINESTFRKFKQFKKYLSGDQKIVLKEIANIMRKNNAVWGV